MQKTTSTRIAEIRTSQGAQQFFLLYHVDNVVSEVNIAKVPVQMRH